MDRRLEISNHQTTSKSKKQLHSSIGRLEHIANIIPVLQDFLGRICHALAQSIKHNLTCLTLQEKSDIHLLKKFTDRSCQGISINNLVFHKPTLIYRSDASEFSIRGYKITSGMEWRFELPVHLRHKTSINCLEFMPNHNLDRHNT